MADFPCEHANTFNRCNIPSWVLASTAYNDHPVPIEILGVRRENRFLFEKLKTIDSADERGMIFNDYMSVKFYLHDHAEHSGTAGRSLKNSYLRFLRGWGVDSNSIEGAVLKAWVESRLGLRPVFHKSRIRGSDDDDEAYMTYATDRMKGSARSNAIMSQLDVVYEFAQFEMKNRMVNQKWITLFRGTNDASEYDVLETINSKESIIRMNNICSFTSDREVAWEFGNTVWRVRVPTTKVFFFNGLLPDSILRGENEYIVIGGGYHVERLLF
jgi:NAD+--dinitrogen-reductase ADP-D-ribosyltransferase